MSLSVSKAWAIMHNHLSAFRSKLELVVDSIIDKLLQVLKADRAANILNPKDKTLDVKAFSLEG